MSSSQEMARDRSRLMFTAGQTSVRQQTSGAERQAFLLVSECLNAGRAPACTLLWPEATAYWQKCPASPAAGEIHGVRV